MKDKNFEAYKQPILKKLSTYRVFDLIQCTSKVSPKKTKALRDKYPSLRIPNPLSHFMKHIHSLASRFFSISIHGNDRVIFSFYLTIFTDSSFYFTLRLNSLCVVW